MAFDFIQGETLLIDKPKGWTSFDVVNKIRYQLRRLTQQKNIKVGHAGTLDPMATGLLIICTGKSTKKLDEYQGQVKEYTGTFTLGATTPSYDKETEVDATFPTDHITPEMIEQTRLSFLGPLDQIPPMFSAIKKEGQPLYKKARAGITIALEPRKITIYEFELTRIALPEIDFRVVCSKGTYIRSLAYDFGGSLGSGAYLSALCRTKIGDFKLSDAWGLEAFLKEVGE